MRLDLMYYLTSYVYKAPLFLPLCTFLLAAYPPYLALFSAGLRI